MSIKEIIQTRRDGISHTQQQIDELVRSCVDGSATDYQLSAWLMAAYLKPLNAQETAWLTLALARSGEALDLSVLPKPHIDKHSTGGVGDKTSIALLPILAACGATLVKISGRGLGITGGTVDKLASIPGFSTDLSPDRLITQASQIGLALSGQTPKLAPADKTLYALRDATETVGSIPLMVASILSKKVAVGAETIVLDVKCGSGAYMKDVDQAEALARALKETGSALGLNVRIALTDMESPLGFMVGNALEIKEALATINGTAFGRFPRLVRELGALALEASGLASSREDGIAMVEDVIRSGRAKAKAKQWIEAQGGNSAVVDDRELLPSAQYTPDIKATRRGWIEAINAQSIGEIAVDLGAGRKKKEDQIDLSAGIKLLVEVGDQVEEGQSIAVIHTSSSLSKEITDRTLNAFRISDSKVEQPPLILKII